jgi:hypothetical protein
MNGRRHSEEQIIAVLKQGEAGVTTVSPERRERCLEAIAFAVWVEFTLRSKMSFLFSRELALRFRAPRGPSPFPS